MDHSLLYQDGKNKIIKKEAAKAVTINMAFIAAVCFLAVWPEACIQTAS